MLPVVSAAQSQAIEQRAIAETGVTLSELMRAAGYAVADELLQRVPRGSVLILAGPGNNGGDGWVAAQKLLAAGRDVRVLTLRHPDQLGAVAAEAAHDAIKAGVSWSVPADAPNTEDLKAETIVDALLGTGSTLPLRPPVGAWCEAINLAHAFVLSVDGPTGVDLDTGACDERAVRADCTVTLTAPKRGLVLYPGAAHAGELVVADLGIPRSIVHSAMAPEIWSAEEYADLLPRPAHDAHKNQRGRVLIVAGSGFFPGAAILAARGAQRSGAGYVTLAVPESIVSIAQSHLQSVPVVGLPAAGRVFSSAAATAARDLAFDYDAVVLGPGMTVADGAAATVRKLVATLDKPLVIDADGLNAFVDHVGLLEQRSAPTVLTPHPGELGRLLGVPTSQIQSDRLSASAKLTGSSRAVVLKGAGTVISTLGRQVINTSGSVALATAGTGDVLSGVIGALLAQGLDPFEASVLAAHLHGRAGQAAATVLTPLCVIAEDLPDYLPTAVAELLEDW